MIYSYSSLRKQLVPCRGSQCVRRRAGLSLLEVLLAIAILGGSLAVLGQLVQIGSRSAVAVRDLTQAQLLCENKLAEISAGVALPEPVVQEQAEESSEWLYSVETTQVDDLGLLSVTVRVEQDPKLVARPLFFSLTRWMVDPAVDAAAVEEQAAADAAAAESAASTATTPSQPPAFQSGSPMGGSNAP